MQAHQLSKGIGHTTYPTISSDVRSVGVIRMERIASIPSKARLEATR